MKTYLKHELRNIIRGDVAESENPLIQTVNRYLSRSQSTGTKAQKSEFDKKQEEKQLIEFIEQENLWFAGYRVENYLSEGAEQKIYLDPDGKHVLKLNTSIFYAS